MKINKIILFLMLLWIGSFLQALSLQEAVELAKKNNKQLRIDWEEVEKAEYTYREVRSSLLPQIYFNGSLQVKNTTLPDGSIPKSIDFADQLLPDNSSEADSALAGGLSMLYNGMIPDKTQGVTSINGQIKMDQVLFLGGKLINGIRVASKYRNLQKQKYQITENQVIFDITDSYQQVLLLKKVVEINQEALQLAREHLSRVDKMHDQGLVSDYDKLRADLEVSRLEPQLTEATNNYDLAMANFKRLIGSNHDEDIVLTTEFDITALPSYDLNEAITTGLNNRIELKVTDIYREMMQVKYNAEKSNFLPNITFSADLTKFSASQDFSVSKNDFGTLYEAGIFMQIPLFTGLGNTSKKLNAKHDLRQAEYQKNNADDLVRLEITQNWLSMKHAQQNLKVYQKNLNLAEKGFQIAKSRFENQIGIQLEVLDAQTQLNAGKVSYINAVYQYNRSINQFLKSIGQKINN